MKRPLATVISTAALAITPMAVAHAEPEPTTGVETGVTEDQWMAVLVEFDYADADRGFRAQQELRAEMWDINPPFNGMSLREAVSKEGLTTKEQYVNGFSLDYNLSHKRPSGVDCAWALNSPRLKSESTATINGESPMGANLPAGNPSITQAVKQPWGYGELNELRAADGQWTMNSGHLHTSLNPQVKFHGFALVKQLQDNRGTNYVATVFSTTALTGGDQPLPKGRNLQNLYRAAVQGETPTGIQDFVMPTSGFHSISGFLGGENHKVVLGIIGFLIGLGLLAALFGDFQLQFGF